MVDEVHEGGHDGGFQFTGSWDHTLDDKGRIVIPQGLRDALSPDFTMTVSSEDTILMFPIVEWERVMRVLREKELQEPEVADAARRVRYYANRIVVDKNGRVVIPPALRDRCFSDGQSALNAKVTVYLIGDGSRIELMSEKYFKEQYLPALNVKSTLSKQKDLGL